LKVPTVAAVQGVAVGAGLNLVLAADLRIVAHDARLVSGFFRIGLHPGGGHFALLGRSAGWEAAAAAGVFGIDMSGERARELGMAWESREPDAVVGRAMEVAGGPARDPELARVTVASFRAALGPPPLGWEPALAAERAMQMWSLRRRSLVEGGESHG
jgi:enoyl-CoA hydratase